MIAKKKITNEFFHWEDFDGNEHFTAINHIVDVKIRTHGDDRMFYVKDTFGDEFCIPEFYGNKLANLISKSDDD